MRETKMYLTLIAVNHSLIKINGRLTVINVKNFFLWLVEEGGDLEEEGVGVVVEEGGGAERGSGGVLEFGGFGGLGGDAVADGFGGGVVARAYAVDADFFGGFYEPCFVDHSVEAALVEYGRFDKGEGGFGLPAPSGYVGAHGSVDYGVEGGEAVGVGEYHGGYEPAVDCAVGAQGFGVYLGAQACLYLGVGVHDGSRAAVAVVDLVSFCAEHPAHY